MKLATALDLHTLPNGTVFLKAGDLKQVFLKTDSRKQSDTYITYNYVFEEDGKLLSGSTSTPDVNVPDLLIFSDDEVLKLSENPNAIKEISEYVNPL